MFDISFETLKANPLQYVMDSGPLFYNFFFHAKNSVKPCPPGLGVLGCKREKRIPETFRMHPHHVRWMKPYLTHIFKAPSFISPLFVCLSIFGVIAYFIVTLSNRDVPRDYSKGLFLLLTAIYFGAITAAFRKPHDRYRMPADPALIMFALFGIQQAATLIYSGEAREILRNALRKHLTRIKALGSRLLASRKPAA
jgi:hypothetical protein